MGQKSGGGGGGAEPPAKKSSPSRPHPQLPLLREHAWKKMHTVLHIVQALYLNGNVELGRDQDIFVCLFVFFVVFFSFSFVNTKVLNWEVWKDWSGDEDIIKA